MATGRTLRFGAQAAAISKSKLLVDQPSACIIAHKRSPVCRFPPREHSPARRGWWRKRSAEGLQRFYFSPASPLRQLRDGGKHPEYVSLLTDAGTVCRNVIKIAAGHAPPPSRPDANVQGRQFPGGDSGQEERLRQAGIVGRLG